MAGHLSHERETGAGRRIDFRYQFGSRLGFTDSSVVPTWAPLCCVDFAGSGLILNTAGEPPWLRVQLFGTSSWRPLEPDAGNAAEGSEGPMPDWRF